MVLVSLSHVKIGKGVSMKSRFIFVAAVAVASIRAFCAEDVSDYRRGGLVAGGPMSVQVDEGAALDLLAFDNRQPIDAITIDCMAGGDTVSTARSAGVMDALLYCRRDWSYM